MIANDHSTVWKWITAAAILTSLALLPSYAIASGDAVDGADSSFAASDTTDPDATLAPFPVWAERIERRTAPGAAQVAAATVEVRDGRSAEEAGPLLPSTRVATNSRGEALFLVRGAPERHVALYEDRIPLVVPWDERADVSLVPTGAIGEVRQTRGVASALDGPNALAGVVHLVPLRLERNGFRTSAAFLVGEGERWAVRGAHVFTQNGWDGLVAVQRRERSALIVPRSYEADFHQRGGRGRTNSDLRQTSAMLRLGRRIAGDGTIRLTLHGMDGAKGVPPESHVEKARFWRYPVLRRFLAGLTADRRLGDRWRLGTSVSIDLVRQEIRKYDDSSYSTPETAPGTDYEKDDDRTAYGSARLTRSVGQSGRFSLQGILRRTGHEESLVVDGPKNSFVQNLGSAAGEFSSRFGGFDVRLGAGYEFASTPETGDKPARERTEAPVLHGRIRRETMGGTHAYLSASRKSRFPSLREMFSGALGRFVPNDELGPERQDLFEAGASWRGDQCAVDAALFASYLDGAIEKVVLSPEEGTFQRVNVDAIRTLGLEIATTFRPRPGIAFTADHTILDAKRKSEGRFGEPAEDRPAYQSSAAITFTSVTGLGVRVETIVTGPRESADASDVADGLRRLPAQGRWNARLSYVRGRPGDLRRSAEWFVRVENAFDQVVESQTGLPEPGRTVLGGIKLLLGG